MLDHTFEEIEATTPQHPSWGTMKNTENKKIFWYGFKGHLAVDCESQYILVAMFSSVHVNDGKMSIQLLKALAQRHPYLNIEHILADAGYDFDAVYEQIRQIGARPSSTTTRVMKRRLKARTRISNPFAKKGTPTCTIVSIRNMKP